MQGTSRPLLTAAGSREFGALTEPERCVLARWLSAAHSVGVEAVEDLTSRRWPTTLTAVVLGVFLFGEQSAAWLAVGRDGAWAVASADGTVSHSVDSLADALAIVYSAREAAAWS
jgi:hypothetical protein